MMLARLQPPADGRDAGQGVERVCVGPGHSDQRFAAALLTADGAHPPGEADGYPVGLPLGCLLPHRDGKAAVHHINGPVCGNAVLPAVAGEAGGHRDLDLHPPHRGVPPPGVVRRQLVGLEPPLGPPVVLAGLADRKAVVKSTFLQAVLPRDGEPEAAGVDQLFVFRPHLPQLTHAGLAGGE